MGPWRQAAGQASPLSHGRVWQRYNTALTPSHSIHCGRSAVASAGRTDKGVSAIGQVTQGGAPYHASERPGGDPHFLIITTRWDSDFLSCWRMHTQVFSFHTREDLTAETIAAGLEGQAPAGSLRVVSVCRRPRSFHATFGAKWRRLDGVGIGDSFWGACSSCQMVTLGASFPTGTCSCSR